MLLNSEWARGGGDIHYCIISSAITGRHTVLLNIRIGGLIITGFMIINKNSGLSSAILAHTKWYL